MGDLCHLIKKDAFQEPTRQRKGGMWEGPARPSISGPSREAPEWAPPGSWSPSGRRTTVCVSRSPSAHSVPSGGDPLWTAHSGLPQTVSPRCCVLRRPLSTPVGSFSWCFHGFVRHSGRVSRPRFSREERGAPRAPQLCSPAGTDAGPEGARAGAGARVPRLLICGLSPPWGAVGERPDPNPQMSSPVGGMRRGVRTGRHPGLLSSAHVLRPVPRSPM